MKKLFILALALCMLTSAFACAEATYDVADCDPVTIVFATANASANIESIYAEKFIDKVEELSQGKITFDYTDGGVLGTQLELIEGTMYGVYDMTCTSVDNLQNWIPEVAVASLPCLFDSYEHATRVFDGEFGEKIAAMSREEMGIDVLNYEFCGFRNICSKKEIKTLDDCKGVLIRVPEVQTYITMMDLMGFSYVTMSWSEAYTAMNSGIIEAVEVPLQNIFEQGFYDLGKNIMMSRHIFNTNSIMVNSSFLDGLPEVYQQILRDAAKEITDEERVACEEKEAGYLVSLEEQGCAIHEWDQASYDQLQETFAAYWNEAASAAGEGAVAMLEQVIADK